MEFAPVDKQKADSFQLSASSFRNQAFFYLVAHSSLWYAAMAVILLVEGAMVNEIQNQDIKAISDKLYNSYLAIDQALLLSFRGFVKHDASYLKEARGIISEVREDLKSIVTEIQQVNSQNAKIEDIAFIVPGHTDRILTNLSIVIEATHKKINESILFSEKAVNELRSLYSSTRGIVKDLADLILTNNSHLAVFITDQSAQIISEADVYSTEHEERLVNGLCSLMSCSIYLDILESLKNSSWHIKQAAERAKKAETL